MTRDESCFLSDLHLSPETPATVARLLDFLAGRARAARSLYILGDLFDAWIGDDDDTPPYPAIRAALRALVDAGTACAFMPGNRDFLVGRAFARETGCTLLRDPTCLRLDGETVLLMHGDLLCTDDLPYQRFRRRVRHPLVRWLFLWKSLAARRALAERYRRDSQTATAAKSAASMDANAEAARDWMRRHGASRLIHGHTHRPGDHAFALDGRPAWRQVLADWRPEGGEILVHRPGGLWRRETIGD